MRIAIAVLAIAACAPVEAIEIKAAQPQCTAADVAAGKVLWKAVDKAPDWSEVIVTATENRQIWCYNDATDPKGRPDTALKVSLTIVPDKDTDADGVPDSADKCPATPPDCPDCVSRKPVDAKGCSK